VAEAAKHVHVYEAPSNSAHAVQQQQNRSTRMVYCKPFHVYIHAHQQVGVAFVCMDKESVLKEVRVYLTPTFFKKLRLRIYTVATPPAAAHVHDHTV
jgi:hypothetical protein